MQRGLKCDRERLTYALVTVGTQKVVGRVSLDPYMAQRAPPDATILFAARSLSRPSGFRSSGTPPEFVSRGPRFDLIRLPSFFTSCGLWTLSGRDFVPPQLLKH